MSAAITGLGFLLVALLGCLLLRGQGFGTNQLFRTAIATSIGLSAATLVAAYYVHRHAGGVVHMVTLLRVLLCVAATVALGRLWSPNSKLLTVVAAAALASVHLVLLIALRELTVRDLSQILSVFRRQPKRT